MVMLMKNIEDYFERLKSLNQSCKRNERQLF